MKGRATVPAIAVISIAIACSLFHPPLAFLDGAYADGFYPDVQTRITSWTNRVPFAVGDAVLASIVAALLLHAILVLRASRRLLTIAGLFVRSAGVAAALYVWFSIAWGWNYARPGLSQTLDYRAPALGRAALDRIETSLVAALDAQAPPAHREHDGGVDVGPALAAAQRRTAVLVGVTHPVARTRPKRTFLDPFFTAADISGMFVPFTYETYIASDVLWFEYPFTLEHEWAHAAGIARESDANFVAALATLDSPDPVVRYSGLLTVYAALPRRAGPDSRLSALVRSDYAAMRRRDRRYIRPLAFKLAWGTYDAYLKSENVHSGVVNYSEYVRLLLGTTVGREALAHATGHPALGTRCTSILKNVANARLGRTLCDGSSSRLTPWAYWRRHQGGADVHARA
jgi:hypothetical protein